MIIDFPLILVCLTVFSGLVAFLDWFMHRKHHKKEADNDIEKKSVIIDYSRSLFPVFLVVLLLRSFLVQPYRVPTGSLEPTVIPGDFILVNQFDYGLRLPVWNKKIIKISEPKTGQIALFYWPVDHHFTFVKRVIGMPGDRISYINKVLYINGKKMTQKYLSQTTETQNGVTWKVVKYEENLNGVKHGIYVCAKNNKFCPVKSHDFYNLVVPKGKYFMMGDNRDASDDSRDWGFVPEKAFVGKAMFIWLSWDAKAPWNKKIRWNRIGTSL